MALFGVLLGGKVFASLVGCWLLFHVFNNLLFASANANMTDYRNYLLSQPPSVLVQSWLDGSDGMRERLTGVLLESIPVWEQQKLSPTNLQEIFHHSSAPSELKEVIEQHVCLIQQSEPELAQVPLKHKTWML